MGKKTKIKDDSVDEYGHLTQRDFEEELEHRKYSMFWDGLDIGSESWVPILKLFAIRMAFIMSQVHLKKHPDEIQQGKEIAY